MILPHMILPHMILPHMILPHMILPHMILPHMILPRVILPAPRLKSNCYPSEARKCSGCLKRAVTLMGYVSGGTYQHCQPTTGERPSGGGA
jgi:hypothetical protein